MAQINFQIPDNKVQKVIDTMKWLFPIPQIEDPNNLGQHPPVMINEFTPQAWVKESLRRHIIAQVRRYDEVKAKEAINIVADNTLIT